MFESPWHWAVVAIVAFVLFFGWKNLPDMSRSLGRSLRIFKTEIKGMSEDDKQREAAKAEPAALEAPAQPAPPPVVAPPPPPPPQAVPIPNSRPRPTPRPQGSGSSVGGAQ
ncbi:MAG TPA: Sec-independent protein translocase subunit TatA [Jatrophihabitans sp.]|jgi:sec-independent protein translocase protein TatA|uniref:Sec-independent protein translocase subunit TatA n=1 Tax=Jatrophihabitans sp. TaxID=1932789 RepID=UPI002E09418D|nr:Sec-independent protein translocase subunit TatA [Jatrophihabitans sp.]